MKKSAVALYAPNSFGSYRSANVVAENLAIGTLGAFLENEGYSVVMCDCRLQGSSPEEGVRFVLDVDVCLVGISIISGSQESLDWVGKLVCLLKRESPDVHIVVGGHFPTLQPERALTLLPGVDSAVLGEGELVLRSLLEAVEGGHSWCSLPGIAYRRAPDGVVVVNPRGSRVVNLDSLPPARRRAAYERGADFEVLIEGSRGCSASCSFCAIKPFLRCTGLAGRNCRSPVAITQEIVRLRRANPRLRRFRFVDPDFFGRNETARVYELARLLQAEAPDIQLYIEARSSAILSEEPLLLDLKKAGLTEVYLGIESGGQSTLDRLRKNTSVATNLAAVQTLRRLGIGFCYGFMMFTPWTTEEDIQANLGFLRRVGKIQVDKLFNELDLIPGTPISDAARDAGLAGGGYTPNGYLKYEVRSAVVERLRRVGSALENDDTAFMEHLWHIYKDVQFALQSGADGASQLEQEADCLFLDIFGYCSERVIALPGEKPQSTADACIATFVPPAMQLGRNAARIGRFPRNA